MSNKARGALFNVLGDIEGFSVLDAFAGTGALSFEAVSRGAGSSLAIEIDREAQKVIEKNIKELGVKGQVKLIKASSSAWLGTSNDVFDLVLCDPPYNDPQPKLLRRLAERVKPGGVVVFSLPPRSDFSLDSEFERLTAKNYGDIELVFYRRLS
jgi:16S rRNA (guanine966-N2)-methyltransferase